MTGQIGSNRCQGRPRAGGSLSRFCALTLAAILATGGTAALIAQQTGAPVKAQKKAAPAGDHTAGNYLVHQSIEVGGRMTSTTGNSGMWDTLVNQGTGGRILGQSLEMHSTNPARTPFFDTLSTWSTGYGGDPYDVSTLKASKGRIYDFAGTFRRDRQYFDYNLLANSLNPQNANTYGLVPENDSPHLFNTVRRNTDLLLTLMPLSPVSIRAGYNRGIHEGPSYSSVHEGADGWLFQNWKNGSDTFLGGVDVKLARRTTVSYDQFYVRNHMDTSWQLAGLNQTLSNGTPVSYGLDPGSGKCPGVVGGVGLANCNGYLGLSMTSPTTVRFPTEQLRFTTHYWDRFSATARFLYSAGKTTVKSFSETFNGLTTRTYERQEIDTGAGPGGRFALNKRDNMNADLGATLDLARFLSLSDSFGYWDFRVDGSNNYTSQVWAGTKANPPTLLTPLSALTPSTTTSTNQYFLNQKTAQNTVLATVTATPQLKFSGGWRYKTRHIGDPGDDLKWHENWLLLGAVVQPSRALRLNVDYEGMWSKSADTASTPSNTYTRAAPDKIFHLRARATVKPAKWINFSLTGNDFSGKNNDPLVNHSEHNQDLSFATSIVPMESLSLDFSFAHDDVFSTTDICYISTTAPPGAANTGTCTAANSPTGGSSYLLGNAYYDAPVTFFSGALNYAPSKYFRFNGGARINRTDGNAEMLNPGMVPGALQSKYLSPFTDLEVNVAKEWSWHGNWTHTGYNETGPLGMLVSRNTHGDVVTLGVKYAF
ncbi:MAG: hypothetical protein WCE75_00155 [Terracidiphilus sp.]